MIVKFSKTGTLEWNKCYGGTGDESGYHITPTSDKGYIFVGTTTSTTGQVSGNHGSGDVWVVKIDSIGNIQWQKCFGGTGNDVGYNIQNIPDGGFIVASSYSGCGGTYLIKLDKDGNSVWENCVGITFGGICLLKGGGFMVVGTGAQTSAAVAKLDKAGATQWLKTFNGAGYDVFHDVIETIEGDYVIAGSTTSKDGAFSTNHGSVDAWIVKLDTSGNMIWQRLYGGSDMETAISIFETKENEYITCGHAGSLNGDVVGRHGTNTTYSYDWWVVKLSASNSIKGKIFKDVNKNGLYDAGEKLITNVLVKSSKSSYTRSTYTSTGNFDIDVDTGSLQTAVIFNNTYYTVTPAIKTSTFTTYNNVDSFDVAVQPIAGKRDLSINLSAISVARPGTNLYYKLVYKNAGTDTIASGTVQIVKSNKVSFVDAVPAQSLISGDTIRWNYSDLKPDDMASIIIHFSTLTPPSTNLGDKVITIATILPVATDLTPTDDTSRLVQNVISSYDPNDKTEIHGGVLTQQQLSNSEWLQYTIRFQNTGTDTAFNIYIRDTLSNKVDWSTLQMITASHSYQLTINDNNKLSWAFNNIKLVDSIRNEPASHGYITYRVKPASTLVAGDTVKNTASIYFDYNLPVATNRESTVVQSIILPVKLTSFTANRDGSTNKLNWNFSVQEPISNFEIERSNDGIHYVSIGKVNASGNGSYDFIDRLPARAINYYRLKMIDKDGRFEYSAIRTINNTGSFEVSIYPNPVRNVLSLKVDSEKKENLQLQIANVEGKVLLFQQSNAEAGSTIKTINTSSLKSGSYFIKVTSSTKKQWLIKFEKL